MSIIDLGSNVVVDTESDNLGGGSVFKSDLYDFKIALAYLNKAPSGALSLNLTLDTKEGREMKQTIYISSGDAKGNKFTYTDKNGNERPLPGFAQMDSLCKLAVDKGLKDMDQEEKTILVYSPTESKEVPTQVLVLTELLGAEITLGILEVVEDKMVKNAEGKYVADNGQTRVVNQISKIFKTEGHLTGSEIAANMTEGEFAKKWLDKNKDQVINKAGKSVKAKSTFGIKPALALAGETPTSNAPATKSLFS